ALSAPADQLGYGPVEGLPQLRRLIAEYVARTRGLRVEPARVVVTLGTAQAMDLMLRALAPVGGIALEDPGPEPVRRLARLHGLKIHPIPVDSQGLRVDRLPSGRDAPRVVHVIPSHQYPTGAALTLDRRLDLLSWAERHDAFILEDDYDSEFRFDQAPPVALAALDTAERVAYLGSFSKTLFPGLRLGFGVVPERLVERVLELKWFSDRCTPVLEQLALADWLETGVFERHVRKMRNVYSQRREVLLAALRRHFGERVEVSGVPAGMHVLAEFALGLGERELLERAAALGVGLYPAGPGQHTRRRRAAVVLGFGNLSETLIERGIARLAEGLTDRRRS
ncbi:MAG TPA: PLP-dependent aminotransferase family protein, partial [Anaerolineales bacterium]|nr:PLP-dependent aminotransferase family protein [Anaerolineales bacterium]